MISLKKCLNLMNITLFLCGYLRFDGRFRLLMIIYFRPRHCSQMTWYHCTFWDVWVSFSQATIRCFFIQRAAITSPPWIVVAVSFCGTEFRKARISYVSRFYHTEMNVLSERENETRSVIVKRYEKNLVQCMNRNVPLYYCAGMRKRVFTYFFYQHLSFRTC